MKKILLGAAILACSFGAIAQKIEVKETNEVIGGGAHNALTVIIYESTKSDVIKAWKSEMKGYDAKVKTNKNGGFADNALIKSISENTVDVHIIASEKDGTVKLTVAFDMGGAFLSSSLHGDKYHSGKSMVEAFARKCTKIGLQNNVVRSEKEYAGIEKEKDKLIKENKSLHKTIEDAKALIEKSKNAIVENEKKQETNTKQLAKQSEVVKAAKKRLSDF